MSQRHGTPQIVSVCSDPTCPSVMVSGGIDKRVLVWDLRAGKGPIAKIQGVELAGPGPRDAQASTQALAVTP